MKPLSVEAIALAARYRLRAAELEAESLSCGVGLVSLAPLLRRDAAWYRAAAEKLENQVGEPLSYPALPGVLSLNIY